MIDEREKVLFMYSSESVVGFRRVFEGATTNRSKIVRREYRDLVKERKEWGREGLPPRIEESSFTVPCIYIYIYLCSGYHAAGGMLIYTKRQDLCGRTARLSRNTAPELSRVGRNDTAKKGRGRSRNRETTRRPCYRSTPAQHYRAIYDPFQKISPTTRAEISSNPEDFSSPRRFLLPPCFFFHPLKRYLRCY